MKKLTKSLLFLTLLAFGQGAWAQGNVTVPHDYSQDYLTFDILSDGTLKWKSNGSGATKTISYSINNGNWTDITSTADGVTIDVNPGDVVRFKGSNTRYCEADKNNYSGFADGTATFNISGNIMSLLYGNDFANVTTLPGSWTFTQFFKQSKCISAENLILPATTMTDCCYRAMFSKCTTLEAAPVLPATTLGEYCYYFMFEECAITSAPELPAPTLVSNCYGNMFTSCKSLNYIKCLAVDKTASGCLTNWVNKVSSTGTFVKDENANWTNGTSGIPSGWVVYDHQAAPEVVVPEDPVITCDGDFITITCQTYGASIYYRLGQTGSYSLYSTPIAIHENTVVEAYAELQSTIVSEELNKTSSVTHDYSQDYLTFDILSGGTLKWKSNGSGATKTISYSINNGEWTSITSTADGVTIDVNPGDVVRFKGSNTRYCEENKNNYSGFADGTATFNISGNIMSLLYGDDFANVTTLPGSWTFTQFFKQSKCISAENLILPATTLTQYCYRAMFSWCTTLKKAPVLPATTLAIGCYWYLFEQCAIEVAPDLLATTLLQECYGHMFEECSKLNYIKCFATSGFGTSKCLENWVLDVASCGTFVKDKKATWSTGIPSGWDAYNYLAAPEDPVITYDGGLITITCDTYGASIYYRLGQTGSYSLYTAPIAINESTVVEAYAVLQSTIVSENCIAIKSYKFAGMEITPGPLYYGSNGYEIKEGWNYDSYHSIYGKTEGSTYFNFIELGQLFESSVFSTADGDIEKVLDPLDGWRVPTNAEWASILGTTRSGSTVNGSSNQHYAMIQLAGVTHANADTPSGLLIFPDGETITGVALSNMDNTTSNAGITASQLNDYLGQGCIFLPGSGFYDGQTWGNGHYYWSSTENNSSTGYNLYFEPSNTISSDDNKDKGSYYFPVYLVKDAADEATRLLRIWTYNNNEVELPYSVNAINGHSGNYAKGTFTFTTDVKVKELQPTYLWFQHADQSAAVYVDNTLVEKHWGGYNAFFVDISNHVHRGINNIKVALKNNEGENLAPCAGDFNFNATLGEVKLISSPVVPDPDYGYDGFHITSTVTAQEATITVKTSVPSSATLTCSIKGDNCNYSETQTGTGEITFTTTITNPHLWNGTLDPYLYDVTLTVAKDGVVYHTFKRGYGLRFFEYVVDDVTPANSRFMLNGSPYLLRGVCMHNDLEGKANALTAEDIDNDFEILKELGCNFVRLAHYPHPKEVYDHCDKIGIIVQTEVPWVNNGRSDLPSDYYTRLEGQYKDMVNQHYNHPSIIFWGLSNETTTDDKVFANEKINGYISLIKNLDSSRLVGYVMSHSTDNPSGYYNDPNADWFGCNIYVGWYIDQNSNNPTNRLNTRLNNTLTRIKKPMAFSEYGCGGTQSCHSDDFTTTTTRGNNPRHDIEYQMWLHEGHIAVIKNFPQLLFTSQWQLFDIAVSSRREGYTTCPDGETAYEDNNLKYLNNKGLVERDHKTKKDPFYLYKAWWNQTDKFVHICGKDYKKLTNRVIKCYTNDGSTLKLFVNNEEIQTATVENNIATFEARDFNPGDVITVTGSTSNDTFTFNYSEEYVFTKNGNWNVATNWTPTGGPATTDNVTINAACTIPATYTAHANNITIGGNGTLTIADGGQLIHSNEGVTATVKKIITGHGGNDNDGWNFIASPLAGITPTTSVANLISTTAANYDLYYYDEAAHYWRNFKENNNSADPNFSLSNGKGYLYANHDKTELQFTGSLQAGTDGTYTVNNLSYACANESLKGFNLVGNPFPCNATITDSHGDPMSFYIINGRSVMANTGSTIIPPCVGVMVQATASGQSVTFTKVMAQQSAQPNQLQLTLAQQETNRDGVTNTMMDNAIVSFNENDQLEKFRFGDNAQIYIPQGGKDYAIAFSEKQGELPLNFKATKNGSYTITVNAEDLEMIYLHLIDNLTGIDIDLLTTPSYTFEAKADDYASRFKLMFSAVDNDNESENFAFISNGEIIINGTGTLQVIDMLGRILVSKDSGQTVSTTEMVPGVYVLRLIDGEKVKTQKIVIK